jgi:hypothetical protein
VTAGAAHEYICIKRRLRGEDMKRIRITVAVAALALVGGLFAGCQTADNANSNQNANRPANENANARGRNDGLSREDFERQKDSIAQQARDLGRKIGQGADDLWLWTKVRAQMAAADDLRDSTVNVDVDNNVVTLTGTVASDAQKAKAAEVARGVEGVRNVTNNLTVSASGGNANTNRNANRP